MDISPNFSTSHTQTTSLNQTGNAISTGISFAPLPSMGVPPIENPGAYAIPGSIPGSVPWGWILGGGAFLALLVFFGLRRKT